MTDGPKKLQSGHLEQNEVEGDQQEDGGMLLRKQQVWLGCQEQRAD